MEMVFVGIMDKKISRQYLEREGQGRILRHKVPVTDQTYGIIRLMAIASLIHFSKLAFSTTRTWLLKK